MTNFMIMASNFWPQTAEGWVALIGVMCTAIGALIALIPVVIKLVKAMAELVKNKNWKAIFSLIQKTVVTAESESKDGKTKKEIVMATAKTFCTENKIEWTEELQKQVGDAIDSVIAIHNALNNADK